jgi:hypothetical protein
MKWQVRHRVVIEQLVEAETEQEALAVAARTEKAELPLLLRLMERGGHLQLSDNGWAAMPLAMAGTVPIQKAPLGRGTRRRPMPRRGAPRTNSDHGP